MDKELKGQIEKRNGGYSIIASTSGVDRDNERILPEAWKSSLKNYMKNNPVILWAHDYSKPPIGKATKGKITDSGLNLDIEFADTDFAREVKSLYDNGFMNSFSVGFIANDGKPGKSGTFEYTDVELLEVSAVPVPANPEANMIRAAEKSGLELNNLKSCYNIEQTEKAEEDAGELQAEAEIIPEIIQKQPIKSNLYSKVRKQRNEKDTRKKVSRY